MARMFHLGWFTNFCTDEWNGVFSAGGMPWDGKFYVEMAQALDRACFDYILFEDKLAIPDAYGASYEIYLKQALSKVPKHDPVPITTLIGALTQNIGVVATMSTLAYPPFMLARLCSTVDHIAGGRFGWNIVTSAEDGAAQNFGMDKLPPKDLRYEMAHEYLDLVNQLFESWDPDAIVLDRENKIYADHTKVREINFKGKYYKCRGPLNTARSPQGRPTMVQAGGSPAGRDFAAKYADCIISVNKGYAEMKAFRDDIRARAEAHGRNPDDVKVMYLTAPVLGETEQEARAKYERMVNDPEFVERNIASIAAITDIDFKKYSFDEPLPERLLTNGEQGSLDAFQQWGSGKTLRQLVLDGGMVASIELIGTPDQVADKMGEAMEAVGGDGFLIAKPGLAVNRRMIAEVCDGLVPALQRRGLMRTQYTGKTLRENLLAF
ncbi:NtaA/DmoA family FMN-dependent monooxygenase [Zavarzinia sp. CC-PAN008]|uniref:NtaA/DmoA family FMN-dependent monooxygenase n=1 Tax=Zavarzinia sp. CC-PAN008 TaxID=3243332 RepID=UPI003F74279C